MSLKRVVGTGLVWGALWIAGGLILVTIIAIVDPDSLDQGEGPVGISAILGPMGFLSGVVFAVLLGLGRRRATGDLSFTRVVLLGFLGSALVQVPYLGHGDVGLIANIEQALFLCAFGVIAAIVWFAMARHWPRLRPA